MRLLYVSVFGSVLLALAIVARMAPSTAGTAAAAMVGPNLYTQEVLHIKSTATHTKPDGTQGETRFSELWYDPTNGDARYSETNPAGDYDVVEVRNGNTYTLYLPDDSIAETHVALDGTQPAFLQNVGVELLGYKDGLEDGTMSKAGEELMPDGQSTIIVQESIVTDVNVDVIRVSVSTDTGLPLKSLAYGRDSLGGLVLVETKNFTFQVIEQVPHTQLPAALFDKPQAQFSATTEYKNTAWGQSFTGYNLYWLDSSFGSMPLEAVLYDTRTGEPGPPNTVHINYTQRSSPAEDEVVQDLSIIQEPVESSGPQYSEAVDDGANEYETVTVNGRQARLYDDGDGMLQLEMVVNGTFIMISGSTARAQILEAATSLRGLNCANP